MFDYLRNVGGHFIRLGKRNRRVSIYLFFFIISFFFWFLSMLSKQHESTLDIPISFSNFPPDLILLEELPQEISVRVKAPGFSIILFNLFNFSILDLDMSISNSKPLEGGQEIFWLINAKRRKIANILGSSMEILDVTPSRISIEFSNKDEKKVPVILIEDIILKSEYWFSKDTELSPDSVIIYGTRHQLESIDKVFTKELKLSNLSNDKIITIPLEDIDGIRFYTSKIKVSLSVEPFVEENIIKIISVKNLNKGYSMRLFPKEVSITVRAPRDKYSILKTDFCSAEVDVSQIIPNNNILDVMINNMPSNIKLQMIYPEQVEYLLIEE